MAGSEDSSRARWGTVNRTTIIDAAVEVARTDGSDGLSIRALAGRLGVSPMALYRHVDNKEDLIDEVVARLLARHWRPRSSRRDWQTWITEAADRLRQFLVDQPVALRLYLSRPVVSAPALERMDACLAVLRSALPDDAAAHRAYAAIQSYTIGFAALEAARESNAGLDPRDDAPLDASEADPRRELAAYSSPDQFRDGLGYLLRGITAGVSRRGVAGGRPT